MKASLSKQKILLLSFALPAAVMAAVFALCGITPFGAGTLGVMDMSHQYLSFLSSLRDILSGRASILYLPSMCLGGNMLGVAAYYLTSPLNLITCLFPRENLYQAVSLLYFLRVGLCGLTMCIYSGRRHGYSVRCLVPAMAYAFMAYMLAYSFNYLWQDCVILLPIISLGIVRLHESRRPWLYILSLAGALYLNFYIGYILCIFSVLFFLYEFFSVPRAQRSAPWHTVLTFAASSVAAGALAAAILIPAFLSLAGGKAEFSLSVLTLTPKFHPADLFSKLYPGAFVYEQIMPEGLPQIFCGTVTMTLAVLYFINGAIPRRRRIMTGALMGIIALSFWITALDLIWHGFNEPNWYNYRYSFILSFLLAAAAGRELAELKTTCPRQLFVPAALMGFVSVLVFAGRSYDYVSWPSAVAGIVLSAAVCAGLWVCLRPGPKGRGAVAVALCILLAHVGELGVNAGLSLSSLTAVASDSKAYAEYAASKEDAFSLVDTGDTFQRVESTTSFDMNRCEPMLFGYDGVSHYGSTLSQESLEFLDKLGLDRYEDIWAIYGEGVTAAADSLLGIRYVVDENTVKGYAASAAGEKYTVWENLDALPIGWTSGGAIASTLPEGDSFSYLDGLYAAIAPEVRQNIYTAAEVNAVELDNFVREGINFLRREEGPACITYTLTAKADGAMYAQLDISDNPGVMVFVNGTYRAWYATAQLNGTLYLGTFSAGDQIAVKLQASSDVTVNYAAFATENAAALRAYRAAIAAGGCELTKLSASHYTGEFTTGEGDSLLVFTLHCDSGWEILLDGEPVSPRKVQDCLTAITVTPGAHTVELRYIPPGLMPGAVISAAAAVLCLAALVYTQWKRRRQMR